MTACEGARSRRILFSRPESTKRPRPGTAAGTCWEDPLRSRRSAHLHGYHPVTLRAVLLGLFGAITTSAFQVVSKAAPVGVALPLQSVFTLFSGVILWLFLLAVANVALRRWRPTAALRPSEFAVVYAISTVAASIAAQDEAQFLLPMFVFPFRATQNDLMGPFRRYIPAWLVPHDPRVVEPYYPGGGTFWKPELLKAWAVPLLAWMIWLVLLGATLWAWNVLLRRRWVDHDRLTFPASQLPLEICKAGGFGGLASGRVFWAGVLAATLLESLQQVHDRFPAVPTVSLDYTATPFLDTLPSPWKALSPMYMMWGAVHLGVCYFIPLDILFSGWFFFLFRKAMEVFGYSMGWRDLGWDAPGFPFTRSQSAGSWAAIFFLLVWAERKHLAKVMASAFGFRPADLDDQDEPASYRTAAWVLLLGMAGLVAFQVAAGMSLPLALIFYAFFWILNVTMTRIYAQVGTPILELYYLDPQKTITTLLGTFWQSPRSWTQFSLMYWINRDDRGQPMAHELVAFTAGRLTRTDPRSLGRWVLIAFAVGSAACLITYLHWAYRLGEDQFASGGWREAAAPFAVSRINEWVHHPRGPNLTEIAFVVWGAVFTLLLSRASYSIIGLPLHPIGYALAVCFALEYVWPAFLAMWVVKALIIRYGGRERYVSLAPFFLGLVLGGLIAPPCWGFLSYLFEWYR